MLCSLWDIFKISRSLIFLWIDLTLIDIWTNAFWTITQNVRFWVLFLFVCCELIPCFWFAVWLGELQLNGSFWNLSFVLETFTNHFKDTSSSCSWQRTCGSCKAVGGMWSWHQHENCEWTRNVPSKIFDFDFCENYTSVHEWRNPFMHCTQKAHNWHTNSNTNKGDTRTQPHSHYYFIFTITYSATSREIRKYKHTHACTQS